MKDWFIPWFKKSVSTYSDEYFDEIRKVDFDCLTKDHPSREKVLSVSNAVMGQLNCRFGKEKLTFSQENFAINFVSVLGDLPKDKFEYLLNNSRKIYYIYELNEMAYNKVFDLFEGLRIDMGEQLKIVIFAHEFSPKDRLACKGLIVHELVHVITGLGNSKKSENCVHQVARDWGFGVATEMMNKYQEKLNTKEG